MHYLSWLWYNSRGIRWNTMVRIVAGIGQVVLGLLMVWFSKRFIDETIRTGTADDVLRMVELLVLTVVGGVILRQVGYWLKTSANVRQSNALRLRIFGSLFHRQLFTGDELHSGDVSSRLAKDIEQVIKVTTDTLPEMLITGIKLCGAFLLMRWFDERLAWALLLLTPLAIVFGKLIARRLRHMTLDIRQDESRIQMQVQEGMEHNAVLRSLGSEQWITDRLDTMQQRLRGNVMRRLRFTVVARLIMGCAFGLGYLMAFVWGGIGLRNGTITFGVMTSFLQLVSMIQGPILQLLNMVPEVIHATASIDRLEELEQTTQLPTAVRKGKTSSKGINFNDVSFRYAKGDREILSHFTHEFKAGSKGPVFYRQVRVGRANRDFRIFKFRSMRTGSDVGSLITIGGRDPRITRSGYFIRKFKLDELPQLINVFVGDMSLVGPRPEVRHYVNFWTPEQMHVLDVRPGITDPASIKFLNENELLEKADNPEKFYIEVVMQEKIKLYLEYVEKHNFFYDLALIFKTFETIVKEKV